MRNQGSGYQQNPPPVTRPQPLSSGVSDEELRAIIVDGDAEKLVKVAERLGKELEQRRLTTSQIRAFFGEVRRIEMNWPATSAPSASTATSARQLRLLRPKLAYQVGRAAQQGRGQGNAATDLRNVLDPAIVHVGDDRTRFQNFVDFFEAILAYHRYHGGRS